MVLAIGVPTVLYLLIGTFSGKHGFVRDRAPFGRGQRLRQLEIMATHGQIVRTYSQ